MFFSNLKLGETGLDLPVAERQGDSSQKEECQRKNCSTYWRGKLN